MARCFARRFFEWAARSYGLALLPIIADRFADTDPFEQWITRDLSIFVMIICASMFGAAFLDRDNGPGRAIAACLGGLGMLTSGMVYGSLSPQGVSRNLWIQEQMSQWGAFVVLMSVVAYGTYRVPAIYKEASEECLTPAPKAARKGKKGQ